MLGDKTCVIMIICAFTQDQRFKNAKWKCLLCNGDHLLCQSIPGNLYDLENFTPIHFTPMRIYLFGIHVKFLPAHSNLFTPLHIYSVNTEIRGLY